MCMVSTDKIPLCVMIASRPFHLSLNLMFMLVYKNAKQWASLARMGLEWPDEACLAWHSSCFLYLTALW